MKPSNIILNESGQPMLVDFGIAKVIEEDMTVDLTGTRGAIGTPEYMSPEQGLGKAVDARTDIYALGVVFYELVTGRKPFIGDTPMETLFKHVNEPLPRPRTFVPDLPVEVEDILLKSLAKQAQDRFAGMGEFAGAIEKIINGQTSAGKKTSMPTPKKTGTPRKNDQTKPSIPSFEPQSQIVCCHRRFGVCCNHYCNSFGI